ncbi:meiotic nuclear division protein 1, partial [Cylindrobasidium torrendii FP15055 ss-10]
APRGLSAEEKRIKLLEIFHETLKELEKLGPKMKGIVSQSVKEVLQSLVDDGLVQGDKIGSSNFFWSFPSQQGALVQTRLKMAQEQRDASKVQLADIRAQIVVEKEKRKDSAERSAALEQLTRLKKEVVKLDAELSAYGACDPKKLEETRRGIMLAKEAAIRWTDNYSIAMSWFVPRIDTDASEVRKFLNVEEEYEDIS